MNTVIIVNLNGIAFHLEEPGFQTLRAYLDGAQSQLAANPDKSEIMSDLEQAIADKCSHYLNSHKNVLTAAEIDDVVRQMGPVQSEDGSPSLGGARSTDAGSPGAGASPGSTGADWVSASASAAEQESGANKSPPQGPTVRRLYQIREGAMLSGVCTGIAAYLDIDVTVVRILFALFTLLTYGLGVAVYIVMALVVPFAHTDEEHAAASGAPFNAQQVIDRAKKHYAEFKDGKEWRRHWKQQRREWRRKWRAERFWWGHNFQRNVYAFSNGAFSNGTTYAGQVFAGVLVTILAIANTLLDCAAVAAIILLASTGSLLGWQLPADVPLWAAILIIVLVLSAITSPMRHARKAIFRYNSGPDMHWIFGTYQLLTLGVWVVVCWFAYTRIPEVREFFANFIWNWQAMMNNIVQSIRHSFTHAPGSTQSIVPLI
jgi:phage shock protein PspC (stress-responsive transcriptional regulator)